MKLLGHGWVGVNAVPDGNKKLLILGSILPEIIHLQIEKLPGN